MLFIYKNKNFSREKKIVQRQRWFRLNVHPRREWWRYTWKWAFAKQQQIICYGSYFAWIRMLLNSKVWDFRVSVKL
jgi:hypothetical protein